MEFPDPLIPGVLIRRYKRFLADVELESGAKVTALCPNTGSLKSLNRPGAEVWLSPARNRERKTRYTWELVRAGRALVGINTHLANDLVDDALGKGAIPELGGYANRRREVRYGRNSRIDVLLEGGGRPRCYVEVKNVTMRRGPRDDGRDDGRDDDPAEFPDAVTSRGTKHLMELGDVAGGGERAVMFYLVQRQDCRRFSIAGDIDPVYADALGNALAAGVEVLCYACAVSPRGIEVAGPLPLDLDIEAGMTKSKAESR